MTSTSPTLPPRPSWLRPATPLARGRLALIVALVVLTVAAWAVTIQQARSMAMPMGIAVPAAMPAGDPAAPAPVTAPAMTDSGGMSGSDGMDSMDGMAMEAPAASAPVSDPNLAVDAAPMAGMAGMGWSLAGAVAFLVAWAVMMAAMMFPAAAPMILLFDRVSGQRRAGGGAFVPTWVFVAGYLLVWTAVGLVAYALVRLGSDVAAGLDPAARARWAPLALGATLVVAGIYQFTPLKRVCLRHCQSPLGFVAAHWRDGYAGALRMGVRHGGYCLGCCWALFAVLVAVGVRSLPWMLLLTLVVFAEKVIPHGQRTAAAVGVAFVLLGVLVGVGGVAMPWTA